MSGLFSSVAVWIWTKFGAGDDLPRFQEERIVISTAEVKTKFRRTKSYPPHHKNTTTRGTVPSETPLLLLPFPFVPTFLHKRRGNAAPSVGVVEDTFHQEIHAL